MADTQVSLDEIDRIAREQFGYESLRPGQAEAIRSIAAGRDTLAVLPTGFGKSAIYQIAAYLKPGGTVVVSPLIALQRDQLESIAERGGEDAAVVNSLVPAKDRHEAFRDLRKGEVEFLFLAPEQFNNPQTLERLAAAKVSLFVVDEAHCISEWGHDFRPDYLKLGAVVEALGHPTVVALTATAAPDVREEIIERLRMREPRVITRGFDRPNIWLGVEEYEDEEALLRALLFHVADRAKPGIVYVATRKHAEQVADELRLRGTHVAHYHAGLKKDERDAAHRAFMEGEIPVMVATNAFGMGVDKPDVRFVIHYDIPDSLDAYYQEVGRAGRDGEPATAVLLYREQDLNLHKFFAGTGQVSTVQLEEILETVQAEDEPVAPDDVRKATELTKAKVSTGLSALEQVGAVEILPTGEAVATEKAEEVEDAARLAREAHTRRRERRAAQLETMREYAESGQCRRRFLLGYFGDEHDRDCGHCDVCEAGPQASRRFMAAPSGKERPFPLQSRVRHARWGAGTVVHYQSGDMVVQFDSGGPKTYPLDRVRQLSLLEAVQ